MPTPTKGKRLGGSSAHQKMMLANLATSLFEHGRITTTHTRAKKLRPVAERLITFAKRGDLAARRKVMTVVRDPEVVHILFTEIGPRYENRNGGYTRIVKLGPRKGDQAPMAVIELVETLSEQTVAAAEAATKRAAREEEVPKPGLPDVPDADISDEDVDQIVSDIVDSIDVEAAAEEIKAVDPDADMSDDDETKS